ncbi:MAG: hypothetical protein GY820_46190 [Gammaproteobacteria bacterium]|nr:hypothetical protein [Gammaproteobacteria bacterium]
MTRVENEYWDRDKLTEIEVEPLIIGLEEEEEDDDDDDISTCVLEKALLAAFSDPGIKVEWVD